MDTREYRGILAEGADGPCLVNVRGERLLSGEPIWRGYLTHWKGRKVRARRLNQRDYETGQNIIILWPDASEQKKPLVELYFNERLVKYPASFLGHLAINVNGSIYNFSHLLNENESLTPEEYFYRPALGEFAPHPVTKRYDRSDPRRPYYDKFGRLFMRTIHVLRLQGIDTQRLANIFDDELRVIHERGGTGRNPEKYAAFNLFTRSCATIIRDGLVRYGFTGIRGIFPRDVFVSAAWYFSSRGKKPDIGWSRETRGQLMVPEADKSALPPLLNPLNRFRETRHSSLTGD
jgi:hypothetical protein